MAFVLSLTRADSHRLTNVKDASACPALMLCCKDDCAGNSVGWSKEKVPMCVTFAFRMALLIMGAVHCDRPSFHERLHLHTLVLWVFRQLPQANAFLPGALAR